MSWLRRIVNVFRRGRVDDSIDEELRFHVDMRAADLERAGLPAADARREARRLLGNPAALRDRTRDADVWVVLETALQDVRYAFRLLGRNPTFTAAAALTLALGIGMNTAMFGVLYAVLIRPLPYADAERLFMIFQGNTRTGARTRLAPLDFVDLQQRSRTFTTAGLAGTGFTLTGSADPELVIGQLVTPQFFEVLGVKPALGRTFESGAPEIDVMVLSHALWRRRFGGDPSILGRSVVANGRPFTVIGVMPEGFTFQSPRYQLWVPFPARAPNSDNLPINRDSRFVQVLARLRPGISPHAGAEDLARVAASLARDYPENHANTALVMSSLVEETVGDVRPALKLLFLAVVLVLLIACGNVTGLLLARLSVRQPEFLVRAALGASRVRIIRQFVVESVVLYAIGAAGGLALAQWTGLLVRRLGAHALPRLNELALVWPVVLFAGGTSLAAALLFGFAAAWHATRGVSSPELRSRTSTSGRAQQGLRAAIVVVQIAVALCLLSGASLVARSLANLQQVDKGFDTTDRLTFNVVMPAARFPEAMAMHAFYRRLLDGLSSQPLFRSVGVTTHLPLSGQDLENGFTVEGYVPAESDVPPIAALRGISPGYVAAMAIPVRAGRTFTAADDENGAPVAIVNETFVRRYLGDGDPIGRRIGVGGPEGRWRTVVGVLAAVKHRGLAAEPRPEVLLPYLQLDAGFLTAWARGLSVVVHTTGETAAAARVIRERMRELDPNMPVITLRPMDELVSEAVAEPRFRTFLLASFALVALVLSAIGIFGVLSYLVSERTREIGIRMALGAQPGTIFREVLGAGMRLTLAGTILGLVAGAVLARWISGLLFRVSPADPFVIAAAALVLGLVALGATFVPARRATRVNPVVALRM